MGPHHAHGRTPRGAYILLTPGGWRVRGAIRGATAIVSAPITPHLLGGVKGVGSAACERAPLDVGPGERLSLELREFVRPRCRHLLATGRAQFGQAEPAPRQTEAPSARRTRKTLL